MIVVLNEKKYAEDCLKNKTLYNKPVFSLTVLAKYYYHCFGYRKKKITELLTTFIEQYYPRYEYNKVFWNENIEKIASNIGKYDFYKIDGVGITQNELNTIENIHNKVLERLAFTLLCLAKLNNLKKPQNNGWVNLDAKEVFKLARISCSVGDRYRRYCKLEELNLLEFPKKNDNLSCRVKFIDGDGSQRLFIYDFRELGYEYLQYKGERFIRCGECGILIRNNKRGTKKYCNSCVGYIPQEKKTIICVDCGKEFEVNALNNKTCRCENCQVEHEKIMKSNRNKRYYEKLRR